MAIAKGKRISSSRVRRDRKPAGLAGIAAALVRERKTPLAASPGARRGRLPYAYGPEQNEWIGRMVYVCAMRGTPLDDPKSGERGGDQVVPADQRDIVERNAYISPEKLVGVVGAYTIVAATVRQRWGRAIGREAVERIYKAWSKKRGVRGIPRLRREHREDGPAWVSHGDMPLFPDSPGWGRVAPAIATPKRTVLTFSERMRIRAYLVRQMMATTEPDERRYYDAWLREVEAAI